MMVKKINHKFYETKVSTDCKKCAFYKKDGCGMGAAIRLDCHDEYLNVIIWIPIKKSTIDKILRKYINEQEQ